ncbi:DUF1905 domain-containing protein [Niabella ginsengisoli]|uniref:YdeI/OmpD-associated family protein n=1 Tax=Niabella ginsengisoli TaxID=522298 RepID=A0ABS9SEJ4_9BACT|nr:DUF1905 domain-containing protein [Niabella ginsengisoli]MCH5596792.1 YdeI/OmpD-associated family protein [Niabella ginsengisoli]
MEKYALLRFHASIDIIGINPFVTLPENILQSIFKQAEKDKGPIPVKGTLNKKAYTQTLLKYKGVWRLYINTVMLKDSPKRIGETVDITISYNTSPPTVAVPVAFIKVLKKDKEAAAVYETLPPSLQKEINRYLSNLKTEESLDRNILRALNFLKGKERFVGRDRPR